MYRYIASAGLDSLAVLYNWETLTPATVCKYDEEYVLEAVARIPPFHPPLGLICVPLALIQPAFAILACRYAAFRFLTMASFFLLPQTLAQSQPYVVFCFISFELHCHYEYFVCRPPYLNVTLLLINDFCAFICSGPLITGCLRSFCSRILPTQCSASSAGIHTSKSWRMLCGETGSCGFGSTPPQYSSRKSAPAPPNKYNYLNATSLQITNNYHAPSQPGWLYTYSIYSDRYLLLSLTILNASITTRRISCVFRNINHSI